MQGELQYLSDHQVKDHVTDISFPCFLSSMGGAVNTVIINQQISFISLDQIMLKPLNFCCTHLSHRYSRAEWMWVSGSQVYYSLKQSEIWPIHQDFICWEIYAVGSLTRFITNGSAADNKVSHHESVSPEQIYYFNILSILFNLKILCGVMLEIYQIWEARGSLSPYLSCY